MESGGRKGTQRMRLGRDGVWWEKGNTENEVGDGWSLVGEREHRECSWGGMESGGRKGT